MENIHIYDTQAELAEDYKMSSANYAEPWLSYVKEDESTELNVKPMLSITLPNGEVLKSYDENNAGITELQAKDLIVPAWNRIAQGAGFRTREKLETWIEDNWDEHQTEVEEFLDNNFPGVTGSSDVSRVLTELDTQYFGGGLTYGDIDVLYVGGQVEQITGLISGTFAPKVAILGESFSDVGILSSITSLNVLVMKNTTPLTGSINSVSPPSLIIVPAASVSAYRSASNWSAYASSIVGVDM